MDAKQEELEHCWDGWMDGWVGRLTRMLGRKEGGDEVRNGGICMRWLSWERGVGYRGDVGGRTSLLLVMLSKATFSSCFTAFWLTSDSF